MSDYRRGNNVIIIFPNKIILWEITELTYFSFYPLITEIRIILKFTLADLRGKPSRKHASVGCFFQ